MRNFFSALLTFIFYQAGSAQYLQTKLFFCGLPIEQSKSAVIKAIASDSSRFKSEDLKMSGEPFSSFDAEIKNYSADIPTASEPALLSAYEVKIMMDDKLKLKIPTIDLTLLYDRAFARRKAKKAYALLTKKIKTDYVCARIYPAHESMGEPWISEQSVSYYMVTDIGPMTFPKCVVTLRTDKFQNSWRLSVSYALEN